MRKKNLLTSFSPMFAKLLWPGKLLLFSPFPSPVTINIFPLNKVQGFPDGAVVENLPANAGDTGSSPGLGRSHMPRSD